MYVKHYMKLQNKPYQMINEGIKKIEMRLYDEKRQLVKIGDLIEFSNCYTNETMTVKVIGLHRFKNFKELYSSFSKDVLGYLTNEQADSLDMEKYYNLEEIKKYGVIGIEIEKILDN